MAKREIYKLDIDIGIKGDKKAQSTLKSLDKYTQLTEKRLKTMSRIQISPTARLNDKLSSPLNRIEQKTNNLSRAVETTVSLNDRASPSIERIGSNLDTVAEGADVNITALDGASGTIAHVDGELESIAGTTEATITVNDQATETIKNIDMSIKELGKGMEDVGKKSTVGLTTPIIATGTAGSVAAMTFETSMNKVSALSGATGSELQSLEAKAREMGKTTQFSAKDSADALGFMSLAGWNATQMTSALEPVLNLAGSAQMGLADASDIVTDTMSMFGMEATEATKATDIFATAQAKSNTDVQQLSEALKYSGAAANAMGYDLADTSAILGTFANAGLKGSTAGTTLNSMFRDMKKESENGAIAIGKTKVAIQDANGNYRDFTDIMGDVIKATEGMSQAEADAAMSAIFGTEALKGVNIMREQGIDSTKNLEEALRNSDGAAKAMNDTMQNGLKGTIDNFKSSVGEAAIVIGDKLNPYIQKAVEWLTQAVDWFSSLDGSTLAIIGIFAGLLAIIGPLLMVGGKLIASIGFMSNGFAILSGAMAGTSAVAGGAAVTIGGVSAAAILIPAAIAVAVAAFVGMSLAMSDNESALLKLQEKFGVFGTVVGGAMEMVGGVVKLILGNIGNLIGGVAESIGILFSKKSWGEKMSALKATWKETWAETKVITKDAMSDTKAETTRGTKLIAESTAQELQGVTNAFEVALGQTENIANKKSSDAARAFTNGIQNLNNDSLTIMRGLNDEMAIILSGVTESMNYDEQVNQITKNLDAAFKSGKISADEYAQGISEAMEFLNSNCADSAGNLKQSLSDVFNAFKDGMNTGGVEDAISGMMNSLNAAPDQVQEIVQNMNGIMGDLFKGVDFNAPISEQISQVVANFNNLGIEGPAAIDAARALFVEAAGKIPDEVASAVEPTVSKVSETLTQGTAQAQQSGNELGEGLVNGVAQGVNNGMPAIDGAMNNITNSVENGNNAANEAISGIGNTLDNGIMTVQNKSSQLSATTSNVVNSANTELLALNTQFEQTTNSIQQLALNLTSVVQESLSGLSQIGAQAGLDLSNSIKNSLSTLSVDVVTIISQAFNGIQQIGVQVGLNLSNSIKASLGTLSVDINGVITQLCNGVTVGFNGLAISGNQAMSTLSTNVSTTFTTMSTNVTSSITSLSSSAISTISSMCSSVTSQVTSMASSVIAQWNSIRSTVSAPITASFNVTTTQTTVKKTVDSGGGSGKSTTKHATGGIFTTPHYALFAEEAGGEAVIPLNGKRRDRAISLWQETGEKLGVSERRAENSKNQSSYFTSGSANNTSNNSAISNRPTYTPAMPAVSNGLGGINVTVSVENNFDNDVDKDEIVQEACAEFGRELKKAIDNIKD